MTKVLFENQGRSFLFFKEHIKKYMYNLKSQKILLEHAFTQNKSNANNFQTSSNMFEGRCNNLQKCENLLFSDARFQFCAKTRSGSIICTFWWISVGPLPSQNLFCLKTWKNEYSELPSVSENSQGRICSIVCKCKFQLPASDVTLWETNQI